jgi:uncharacterized protein (TIGR03118 family)
VKRGTAILWLSSLLASLALGCGGAYQKMSTTSGFQQTNLVSDQPGSAAHVDRGLLNPWGIAFAPRQPFWIANNLTGTAKQFDNTGTAQLPLGVAIPIPTGNTAPATPTAVVYNPVAQDFVVHGNPAQYLFATEDGTISTWGQDANGDFPTSAVMVINNTGAGSVYTGLAIPTPACCREYLALVDFHNGIVATRDISFNLLATIGNFTDPSLPAGYAPYNIQQIGTQLFVTYAVQDAAKQNAVPGMGNGIVDIFDQEGTFVRRFVTHGVLNAPWGIVQASSNFGPFSNDILIGNFGDGTINAFDPATGNFIGQLRDLSGNTIVNPGLWALSFRNDGVGDPNTLYFTAGLNQGRDGLFAAITYHM